MSFARCDPSQPANAAGASSATPRRPAAPSLRPTYDWQDDARKSYRLACDLIGERIMRQRIIGALKFHARHIPPVEIAEAIE